MSRFSSALILGVLLQFILGILGVLLQFARTDQSAHVSIYASQGFYLTHTELMLRRTVEF